MAVDIDTIVRTSVIQSHSRWMLIIISCGISWSNNGMISSQFLRKLTNSCLRDRFFNYSSTDNSRIFQVGEFDIARLYDCM